MRTMAECHFRVACIKESWFKHGASAGKFRMYSRNSVDEETYYHGIFDSHGETVDEYLISLEQRCDELEIKFIRGYARSLALESYF